MTIDDAMRLAANLDGAPPREVELRKTIEALILEEREACATLISSGEFCRYVEHAQDYCDCKKMADAIRMRSNAEAPNDK